MDAKTRSIVLIKYKPMIEEFKKAIAEERKKGASEARIAAIIHYVETSAFDIDPEAMEMMRTRTGGGCQGNKSGHGNGPVTLTSKFRAAGASHPQPTYREELSTSRALMSGPPRRAGAPLSTRPQLGSFCKSEALSYNSRLQLPRSCSR